MENAPDSDIAFEEGVSDSPLAMWRVVSFRTLSGYRLRMVHWFESKKHVQEALDRFESRGDEIVGVYLYHLKGDG